MTEQEVEELVEHCPRAYHMAERGAWEGIRRDGLLSTTALLDMYGISGEFRQELEASRRSVCVPIARPGLPGAIIRDQLPMDDSGLRRSLPPSISPSDWYQFLNNKVFFWLTEERLWRLAAAKAYRDVEHEVIVVDTRKLINRHRERIWLCPINSGCTKPMPHPRDYSSFSRISDYPYAHWRSRRKKGERVVELCVDHSVHDIEGIVSDVYVVRGRQILQDNLSEA